MVQAVTPIALAASSRVSANFGDVTDTEDSGFMAAKMTAVNQSAGIWDRAQASLSQTLDV
jgi:hypothetical protein